MARLADIRSLRVLAIGISRRWGAFSVPNLDDGLARLDSLDNLEDLTLYGWAFADGAIEHLTRLRSLRRLELYETEVTHIGLARLRELRSLKVLSVRGRCRAKPLGSGYYTPGPYPSILSALVDLDNVEQLTVNASEVCEEAAPFLRQMKSLAKLRVMGLDYWRGSKAAFEELETALPNTAIETVHER